jgi:hypothetical protein
MTIKTVAKKTMAIIDSLPTPNKIRKIGNAAVTGRLRKKSRIIEVPAEAMLDSPIAKPIGMPIANARKYPKKQRLKVAAISQRSGPEAISSYARRKTATGVGNKR